MFVYIYIKIPILILYMRHLHTPQLQLDHPSPAFRDLPTGAHQTSKKHKCHQLHAGIQSQKALRCEIVG